MASPTVEEEAAPAPCSGKDASDSTSETAAAQSALETAAAESTSGTAAAHSTSETTAAASSSGKTTAANEDDPYFYTKTKDFTSEVYKIEIHGLPARFGFGQLKNFLNNRMRLNCHKIKGPGANSPFAFVTFRCEEDRENALVKLNGFEWKRKTLSAMKANPAKDPIVKRQMAPPPSEGEPAAKKTKADDTEPETTIAERLNDAVSPLWRIPYEQQLKQKEESMHKVLLDATRQIEGAVRRSDWIIENKKKYGGLCCEVQPIRASPVTDGYRNKCELTVGTGPDKLPTVGFRLSRYVDGCVTVADVDGCVLLPEAMKRVARAFQVYIRTSDLAPYDPQTGRGYWRQLTVRTTNNDDVLVIAVLHPQNLTPTELAKVKDDLRGRFETGEECRITALYFQPQGKRLSGQELVYEHVFGEKYIYESLLGLMFRISPDAFFQTNTAAAEVLYRTVAELVVTATKLSGASTVALDVCCGTGTIGLTLAKTVMKVVGVEMVAAAVEDANYNREKNGLTNVEFICSKAEDAMSKLLTPLAQAKSNIVAIVDPPRAGLHNKVVRSLRWCREVTHLIYVSCNPKGATTNFIDLCRLPSNQYNSDPFVPVVAIPIDQFPHTTHCELVVLFERAKQAKSAKPTVVVSGKDVKPDVGLSTVQPPLVACEDVKTDLKTDNEN